MKSHLRMIILLLLTLTVSACTTRRERPEVVGVPGAGSSGSTKSYETADEPVSEPRVNPEDVAQALRINASTLPLGLREYEVNLCQMGLSKTDCGSKTFSVTKFRVMCRDSEGTVEYVSEYDYVPLARRNLEWRLGAQRGNTFTNAEGEGVSYSLGYGSQKYERYILIHGKSSLGLRLNQVRQIVVPYNWCS